MKIHLRARVTTQFGCIFIVSSFQRSKKWSRSDFGSIVTRKPTTLLSKNASTELLWRTRAHDTCCKLKILYAHSSKKDELFVGHMDLFWLRNQSQKCSQLKNSTFSKNILQIFSSRCIFSAKICNLIEILHGLCNFVGIMSPFRSAVRKQRLC